MSREGRTILKIHGHEVGGIKRIEQENSQINVVCGDSFVRTYSASTGELISKCGTNLSEQERAQQKKDKQLRKKQFRSKTQLGKQGA